MIAAHRDRPRSLNDSFSDAELLRLQQVRVLSPAHEEFHTSGSASSDHHLVCDNEKLTMRLNCKDSQPLFPSLASPPSGRIVGFLLVFLNQYS